MKTLVVLAHPGLGKSVINKRWKEELEKHPDKFLRTRPVRSIP